MTDRHIAAMGGGGFGSGNSMLDRYALSVVDAERPKVCFIPTASGDDAGYTLEFYKAYSSYGCEPFVLNLFSREVEDIRSYLLGMDMVYVGGGSTANLLAVWRLHGLDEAHDILPAMKTAPLVVVALLAAGCADGDLGETTAAPVAPEIRVTTSEPPHTAVTGTAPSPSATVQRNPSIPAGLADFELTTVALDGRELTALIADTPNYDAAA